ncbi:MAG: ATP-grasp fold amidoligase family protein [Wenzhouxiangella sp.]
MRRIKDKFWAWLLSYKHRIAGRRTLLARVIDWAFFPRDYLVAVRGYWRKFGRLPNISRPRSFNECVQRRKLFERDPRFTVLADKLAVRKHVAERVGEAYLTKVYWTGTDLMAARRVDLPSRFVVKSNHSTATNLIITDADDFSWPYAAGITRDWLLRDLSFALAEWHYRWIPPLLYIEEYLEPRPGSTSLTDYKFFVFHGKARFLRIIDDRLGGKRSFGLDMRLQPIRIGNHVTAPLPGDMPRPRKLDEMIEVAERISLPDLAFQRVDLYEVSGRVVFGEMTFTPAAGLMKDWEPKELHEYLGALSTVADSLS